MSNITERDFLSIKECYAKATIDKLPTFEEFNEVKSKSLDNDYYESFRLRALGISKLRTARDEGKRLDIKEVWSFISKSITILPVEATISSIGSQGFLSIPLLKCDSPREQFEFIRLHIWDTELDRFVNQDTRSKFSIHNHAFHAVSWILCGEIVNDRFIVDESNTVSSHSLFDITYNNTLNEVNQHTSVAMRTEQYVKPIQISHEIYMQGGNYSIKAGEYHRSGSNMKNEISATLFSFTADSAFKGTSSVVGPSVVSSSEVNRKELIDPFQLLSKIDSKMRQYE